MSKENIEPVAANRNFTDDELRRLAEDFTAKRKKGGDPVRKPVLAGWLVLDEQRSLHNKTHTEEDLDKVISIIFELTGIPDKKNNEETEPSPHPLTSETPRQAPPQDTTKITKDSFGLPEISEEEKERARRYRETRPDLYE